MVLFSTEALEILNRMIYDPEDRPSYEIMSGGLLWRDEFPPFTTTLPREGKIVWKEYAPRYLIAFRASITCGEERIEFRPIWEQVVEFAPSWPGLRPDRRDERMRRLLRWNELGMNRCLDGLGD